VSQLPDTLPALIEQSAARFENHLAIVDGPTRLSFRGLSDLVNRVGDALVANGLEPGDRVSIWSPNTFHWVVAALGVQRAGATLIPLNTRYTATEAIDVLRRSSVRILLVPDRFLGRDFLEELRQSSENGASADLLVTDLPDLKLVVQIPIEGSPPAAPMPAITTWAELIGDGDGHPETARPAITGDSFSDILFTSGTTGRPKGAISTHRQTIAVAASWAECAEVTERDVYLIINPFFHSFGYKAGWVVSLLRGATIIPALTFDLDSTLETVARERVTILPGPPTVFYSLLSHPRRRDFDLSSLRLAVTGAAPVPVALIERMRDELTFETILTAYGLSEAVVVTMCRPDDTPEIISQTSGRPTTEFAVRIAGESGLSLPAGEDGEIQLHGPNIMVGYLDDPEATAAAFTSDDWFRTGDIGHLDERGYLTITDRLKDMFTTGGFNVYPAEVENAILSYDGIKECAVLGSPDERLGEVGVAFVITDRDATPTEQQIVDHCRGRLANFKVPRRIVFVSDLPHSAAGKVLKRELRDSAEALVSARGA
jgi:acyl-CoA synthetase (AMP-forming)/AMP-acid ligase II